MRSIILVLAALSAAPSCQGNPDPKPVTPPAPSVWPPEGDVCEAQCHHVVDELACPLFVATKDTCVADCRSLDFQRAAHSQNPVNHACIVAANDCQTAMGCK